MELYSLLQLMHNMRQPYHTFSYFESNLSRTRDASGAYSFGPFIIKFIFFLIYLANHKLEKLLKKQKEIEGLLSEHTPYPIPRRCYISGHSCFCTTYKCQHLPEPAELQ
jgi:hypothetical protein